MEERKSNKKTRIVIIASMLLLLIAIACLCGTTFARYITKKDVPSTQATVAKWGFVVNADASKLFSDKYDNTGVASASGTSVVTVKANNKVVAPGTKGEVTFRIEGTAEVLAQVDIAVSADADTKEVVLKKGETDVHKPVKWTLWTGTKGEGGAMSYTEVAAAKDTDLATVLSTLTTQNTTNFIDANTDCALFYKISWEWAFETPVPADITDADEIAAKRAELDKYDTLLGYAAAGEVKDYGVANVTAADTTAHTATVVDSTAETDNEYSAEWGVSFTLSIGIKQVQSK